VSGVSYFFAILGSLFLHGCFVLLLLSNWQFAPELREIPKQPQAIKATLVELESKAPEPAKPQPQVIDLAAKRRAEQKAAEEARRLAQRQRDEDEKKRLEAQRLKNEAAQKQQKQEELEEQERLKKLEEERIARQKQIEQQRQSEFEQALAAEEAYQAQQQEAAAVTSVTAEIGALVAQNWSRPPSARRGMEAILRVSLVPTGGLSSVEVIESSGDNAFDRSATLAVQKAAPFEVVKKVSPLIFEKNFRTFLFRFNPQDLRL